MPPVASPPVPKLRLIDRVTSPAGLVLSAALLALILPVTSPIRDPDFWWHLRAGQMMLASHHLIATDPFTYTVPDHTWVMHEWATEVSFAWLHSFGGLGLIVAIIAAITWLGLLAICLRARLHRPNTLILALGLVVGGFTGYPIWGPRVQMLTFALAALVLLATEHHLRTGTRRIWWLVPMFLVWSNFHSGFIIGIGFMVTIAVADLIGGLLRWDGSAERRRAVTVLLVAGAGALAAMINPNGPGIVLYPFATQGSAAQQAQILEWHSPDLHLWEVAIFYAPMLLSLAAVIAINRRIRARDAALVLVTVVLSLQSVRHIALFVVAVTPIWIAQVDLLVVRWRERRNRGRRVRPAALPPLPLRIIVYLVVVAIVGSAAALRFASAVAVREDSLVYAQDMPVCVARWLNTAPSGLRIFNQYGEGGYLAYTVTQHGDRIFIFGDAALMGDDMLTRTGDVQSLRPNWQEVLDSSSTDLVVFDAKEPLTTVLKSSSRWTSVYVDNHNEAFVRTADLARLHLPPQPPVPSDPHDACAQLATTPPGSDS